MQQSPRTDRAEEFLALERFLPFRLSVLSNRMTRTVARVYARRLRLSAPEWRTVAVLGRYGAMAASSVVERTAMDKVRVSRAAAKLVAAELITRHADAEDRRRAILDLTSKGLATYRQLVPLVLATEAELLSVLSAEERHLLLAMVDRLEAHAAGLPVAPIEVEE